MALREGECFLVRRVADRGIDKSIGDSRVRGDRLNCDRRSAGRGNKIRNRDPRDIIKIKRLRQRVQDLEEIKRLRQRVRDLKEIRRLHQRVRDLELQWEVRKTETESSTVVWDEGGDGEEHPFGRHPPRFYEPIYLEFLLEDKPVFDDDGIEPDEKECSFVREVLREKMDISGGPSMSTVVIGSAEAAGGVETPLLLAKFVEGMIVAQDKVGLKFEKSINLEILYERNNIFSSNMGYHDFKGYENFMHLLDGSDWDYTTVDGNNYDVGPHHALKGSNIGIIFDTRNLATLGEKNNADLLSFLGIQLLINIITGVGFGEQSALGWQIKPNAIKTFKLDYFNGSYLKPKCSDQHSKPSEEARETEAWRTFDPGGIGPKLGKMTREVKQFRQVVVIITSVSRVDVPFDPGGFRSKTTRGRVFFEDGENDADRSNLFNYLLIYLNLIFYLI
ncbi:hypothetical protein Hanom_Chr03g00201011 [Helianthus anomalus]